MSIKVKAVERNVSFDKSKEKWAYVMQTELYSKLTPEQSDSGGCHAQRYLQRLHQRRMGRHR